MLAGHKFGACLPTFGSCADRYCLSGYGGGGTTIEEMLNLATKVDGLDGTTYTTTILLKKGEQRILLLPQL